MFAPGRASGACTCCSSGHTHSTRPGTACLGAAGSLPVHSAMEQMRWQSADLGCLYCTQRSPPCCWHCSPRPRHQPSVFTRPSGSPRGTCPAPKRLILAQVGKSLLCSWMLKICPIICQKLAVGGCANRCTKRQNYALQTVKYIYIYVHVYVSDT